MPDLLRFLFEVLTNFFFIPSIVPLARHRRHFQLFVGVTQLIAAFFYSVCDYTGASLFIAPINWHFMSDVLSLTYACLLLIHMSAFEDEEVNIVLRYLAFFLSWLFKYRDSWDSTIWESLLVAAFLGVLTYSHLSREDRRRRFKNQHLQQALIAASAGLAFFGGQLMFHLTDAHRILMGLYHACAGYACYEFWQVLPPPARGKKLDDVTSGAMSYV
jgi:hypothetical protein